MSGRRRPLPLPTSAQTAAAAQVHPRCFLWFRWLRTHCTLDCGVCLPCCTSFVAIVSTALPAAWQPSCLPPGLSSAGNPETLNYLFAADRDALRAMVSLMRSADMDAARLGLQASSHGAGGLHLLLP